MLCKQGISAFYPSSLHILLIGPAPPSLITHDSGLSSSEQDLCRALAQHTHTLTNSHTAERMNTYVGRLVCKRGPFSLATSVSIDPFTSRLANQQLAAANNISMTQIPCSFTALSCEWRSTVTASWPAGCTLQRGALTHRGACVLPSRA